MEDLITNFELVGTRLLRVCPVCGELQDEKYALVRAQSVLREQCPKFVPFSVVRRDDEQFCGL